MRVGEVLGIEQVLDVELELQPLAGFQEQRGVNADEAGQTGGVCGIADCGELA